MTDPQPDWQHHHYTTWVYTGVDREERNARLNQVPEDMREYVKDRVTYLFNIGRK